MRWAISRHFRTKGLEVSMTGVRAGNAIVDGEVVGKKWRMALEIKSSHDDPIRGIGQLIEALSHGSDSKTRVHQVYP